MNIAQRTLGSGYTAVGIAAAVATESWADVILERPEVDDPDVIVPIILIAAAFAIVTTGVSVLLLRRLARRRAVESRGEADDGGDRED